MPASGGGGSGGGEGISHGFCVGVAGTGVSVGIGNHGIVGVGVAVGTSVGEAVEVGSDVGSVGAAVGTVDHGMNPGSVPPPITAELGRGRLRIWSRVSRI